MASGKSLMQLSKCALSTQATGQATKMVRPPVSMFGIDGRYATALYSAASKKGKLQQVDQNLKMLLQLNEKDVRFREFLMNPLVKPAQKREILSKSLQATLNLDELTINLLTVLAENNRMKFLPLVARAFNKTMAFSRGEVNVTITAASPFDAESKKALDEILQNFAPGKKLIVSVKIDKSILGGLIVDFDGEHYVDMSIKRKFNQYSNILKMPL
ncbi:ATP synthase subunit O, mitochondrial [Dermatophagoides pteronyssinus]|uniref:Oligomycin sensitivity conferral protein n=1 Tax=Dermatophagoides pteronyssinus TaxID=6956 RepID=A0ABQ8J737_DERPT|nr:ATP synthase subunit O, mitochondrial [Dermatophagoides pteronyssinus]